MRGACSLRDSYLTADQSKPLLFLRSGNINEVDYLSLISSGSSGVTFPSIDIEQLIVNLLWFLVMRLVQTPGSVFAIDWIWVGGTLVSLAKTLK